ncbi:ABC transporter substrate-binding protein [Aquipuribacter hungaricus]|uniref:ABC transporter substrate-binding protein n=1 Tax=Aquipuribacter hungaricus TaxID=545624 RepID=A0ABV7WDI2_9MICO
MRSTPRPSARLRRGVPLLSLVAASALLVTGCANPGETTSAGGGASDGASAGGGQVVREPSTEATGEGCTLDSYAGGIEAVELEGATVGFSQSEPDTAAFRAAETQSIRDEAEAVGAELIVTNANAELPKQISDIQDLLNQGVDLLIVAPLNSDGLDPALSAASEAGVPVITIDRKVTSEHCSDYVTFIGSDFYSQGQRAADAMAEATEGEANVAILLGSSGNNVTDQRNQGFLDQVEAEHPGLEVVVEQTANFARDEGQTVTEQLLQSNPEIDAIYAHNDEMALGAVTAVSAAGRQPGSEVRIVSIDGTANAVQAIVDGQINAVIESNPRFGPLAFETAQRFFDGEPIAEDIIIEDDEYNPENAEANLADAF